jgi:flagellar FliL protein
MAEAEPTAVKNSKSKLVFLLIVGVGLIGVVGIIGWLLLRPTKTVSESERKGPKEPEVKTVLHLENFVVNLADSDENRFLRVGIDLGLEKQLDDKGGREEGGSVPLARVRDTILGVLTTWRSDALLAPEGKEKLKQELLQALRRRVPELGVREVYFTDFLVQR